MAEEFSYKPDDEADKPVVEDIPDLPERRPGLKGMFERGGIFESLHREANKEDDEDEDDDETAPLGGTKGKGILGRLLSGDVSKETVAAAGEKTAETATTDTITTGLNGAEIANVVPETIAYDITEAHPVIPAAEAELTDLAEIVIAHEASTEKKPTPKKPVPAKPASSVPKPQPVPVTPQHQEGGGGNKPPEPPETGGHGAAEGEPDDEPAARTYEVADEADEATNDIYGTHETTDVPETEYVPTRRPSPESALLFGGLSAYELHRIHKVEKAQRKSEKEVNKLRHEVEKRAKTQSATEAAVTRVERIEAIRPAPAVAEVRPSTPENRPVVIKTTEAKLVDRTEQEEHQKHQEKVEVEAITTYEKTREAREQNEKRESREVREVKEVKKELETKKVAAEKAGDQIKDAQSVADLLRSKPSDIEKFIYTPDKVEVPEEASETRESQELAYEVSHEHKDLDRQGADAWATLQAKAAATAQTNAQAVARAAQVATKQPAKVSPTPLAKAKAQADAKPFKNVAIAGFVVVSILIAIIIAIILVQSN